MEGKSRPSPMMAAAATSRWATAWAAQLPVWPSFWPA